MTMSAKFSFRILQLVLLSLTFTAAAFAQGASSEVNGVVKDTAGAVLSGATLKLIDTATNSEVSTTSHGDGAFLFANVRPGNYKLIVEQTGFSKKEIQDIKVDVGVPYTVNVELAPGGVAEVVTVSATDIAAPLNSTNAELSTTVQTQQINDLPLNGRNPLDLAGLQAGVAAGATNRTATINGLRGTFSNLTWDGININDNFIRTDALFGAAAPSVPGVAEFTLVTQNAGPADGLGVAQVKLVTPRGGANYHGTLWEYHRNDAFDANSFFNNAAGLPKAKLIRNQFGAAVGGPFRLPRFGEGGPLSIGKDKLFFYGYYEGTRERTDAEIDRNVLTQSARSGLFSYNATCTANTCPQGISPGQLVTVNLLNLTGTAADPLATQLIGLTPLPNDLSGGDTRNFANFRFNSPAGSDDDIWGFRIDFDANSANHFDAAFSRDVLKFPNDTFNDIGEPFPGLPGGGQSPVRTRLSTSWNWAPTPTFTNELRGGFFFQKSTFFSNVTHDRGFRVTLPAILDDPEQNFLEQGRNVDTWEIIDNAGKSWGNHFIRFGGNYRLVKINPFNAGGTIPLVTLGFNDAAGGTPNPLDTSLFPGGIGTTDFNNATSILATLSGSIATVAETFNASSASSGLLRGQTSLQNYRYWNIGPYIGDTWRVRPNLTINMGLRWEYVSVPKEVNGLLVLPQGGLESLLGNPLIEPVTGGGRQLYKDDWNNFAPSFSFAWDPFGDGKTSFRGGYGISYVIDNNITTIDNAANRGGFTRSVTLNDPSGTISGGIPTIEVPTLTLPFRARDVFTTTDPAFAIFTIDPELKTPYVQQWNLGVQREVLGDMVAEVRYVGNRGTKLTRGIDINQQQIFNGGFFEDFQRARFNFINCGGRVNPTQVQCANRQPLQVLPSFGAFALNQATFLTAVRQGEAARALDFFIGFKEFFFADFGGGDFGSTQLLSTYLPNPNTYVADFVGNGSYSTYNALQAELRQRLKRGFDFQLNYTWSKAFTDFEGSQANFSGLLDLAQGNVKEKRRGINDLTHVFKANAGYELPFGSGKRFLNEGMWSKVFGGMKLSGIFVAQSGRPISFISNRGTLNRVGRSANNTANTGLSIEELQALTGLFFDPTTGRPLMFSPEVIAAVRTDTSLLRDQNGFFSNPLPGTTGNLQLTPVSGPGLWNLDMGFIKRTPITETVNIEFRMEAFNVFNKTNFFIGSTALNQNINAATFGQITETFDPRILQFALKLNF